MSALPKDERPPEREAGAGVQEQRTEGGIDSCHNDDPSTERLSAARVDRIEQLREMGVSSIVLRIGWSHTTDSRGRVATIQCPGCAQPATKDRKGFHGADVSRPKGRPDFWIHGRCGGSGGGVEILMAHAWGRAEKRPSQERWRELFDAAARLGLIDGQESRRGGVLSVSRPTPLRPTSPRPCASVEAPKYPPWREVQAYWQASRSVVEDENAGEQLRARGFKPAMVDALGCVRATPSEAPPEAPALAPCLSWRGRHAVLFGLFDVQGRLRAPHARDLRRGARKPKGLFLPEFNVRGLVFATERIRALLVGEERAVEEVRHQGLRIVEGAPDFLSSVFEHRFMFSIGVVNGSWPEDSAFAKRIPDGTPVYLATQSFREDGTPDETGRKYARQIWKSLRGRRVQLLVEPGLLDGVAAGAERDPGEDG
jgi:hypothetical protein